MYREYFVIISCSTQRGEECSENMMENVYFYVYVKFEVSTMSEEGVRGVF